ELVGRALVASSDRNDLGLRKNHGGVGYGAVCGTGRLRQRRVVCHVASSSLWNVHPTNGLHGTYGRFDVYRVQPSIKVRVAHSTSGCEPRNRWWWQAFPRFNSVSVAPCAARAGGMNPLQWGLMNRSPSHTPSKGMCT